MSKNLNYQHSKTDQGFVSIIKKKYVTHYYLNGKLHREDSPAIEYVNGDKIWYKNGLKHREDGPAVELASGTKEWHLNGKLHRENGPAILGEDCECWYLNGKPHRDDGPAIQESRTCEWLQFGKYFRENNLPQVEMENGCVLIWTDKKGNDKLIKILDPKTKQIKVTFHKNGNLHHRKDGPAIEYANGTKFWLRNNVPHRDDGPAVELSNGTKEIWKNGFYLSYPLLSYQKTAHYINKYFYCNSKITELVYG